MTTALQLALIPLAVGMLLAIMTGLKHLAGKLDLSAEVQRKAIHVCTGLFAMTFPWLFPSKWPAFLLLGLTLAVMVILRLPAFSKSGIGTTLHGVERQTYGDFLLVFAVGAIFLLSDGDPLLYGLPIAVLSLSDAAAALAGSTYGRRMFPVADGAKSYEGVTIFFLVTWILSMVALLLFSEIGRGNVIVLSLMIAAFGALIEADSWHGYDNLFVPLGVFLLLSNGLGMTMPHLGGLVVSFVVMLAGFSIVVKSVGGSTHTARIYVVVIFLITAASTLPNAILPVLALLAHAAAKRLRPCMADFPDLDSVAAIGVMSTAWLATGTVVGPSSINFYGLAFVGFTLVLAGVATSHLPVFVRAGIMAGLAAALVTVFFRIVAGNGPDSGWSGDWTPAIAATILFCAALPMLVPNWFDHRRGPKTALISSLVPMGFYLAASLINGH